MVRAAVSLQAVAERLQGEDLLLEALDLEDMAVSGVSQDSRDVQPGDLFLCWKGLEYDAHAFLHRAADAGAVAAVVETLNDGVGLPQLQVSDGRRGAALASDEVLGSPWKSLFLGGVTGTNGKTTTCVLARHLLSSRGTAQSVGTLGLLDEDGKVVPETEGLTTPGPVQTTRSGGFRPAKNASAERTSRSPSRVNNVALFPDVPRSCAKRYI